MNIALLRKHCALNIFSSISGVFPNNQDHRIQFIVEDYEAFCRDISTKVLKTGSDEKSTYCRHVSWLQALVLLLDKISHSTLNLDSSIPIMTKKLIETIIWISSQQSESYLKISEAI